MMARYQYGMLVLTVIVLVGSVRGAAARFPLNKSDNADYNLGMAALDRSDYGQAMDHF